MENIEEKVVEMRVKQSMGYKRIGKILGIGPGKVSDILIKNNITDHVTMPEESVLGIIKTMYNKGNSLNKICKHTKMSKIRVSSILKIIGIQVTPSGYHSNYQSKIDHNYFDKIDTERKAYWLGLLYADGYNNEKSYQIELTLKKEDKYILEEFKSDLQAVHNIKDRLANVFGKKYECSRLTIYSKQISKDLSKYGCKQAKTFNLTFPKKIPKNLLHHFMRGYFDGDGCISISGKTYIFIISGTKLFLEKYTDILYDKTNITKTRSWGMDGKAHHWRKGGKQNIIKLYNFLYKDSTIFLKRKKDKFLFLIDLPSTVENAV